MAKSHNVIGRYREKTTLDAMLGSGEPELLAIYGRRRVGKTHLIREYCEPRVDLFIDIAGQKEAPTSVQLFHFKQKLERIFYRGTPLPEIPSWEAALTLLVDIIEKRLTEGNINRVMIFLDELPWLATRHSRLLQSLEHCWNTRISRISQICLVVCGSAASWMLDKVVHAKGGLHNRLTRKIRLEPLNLRETKEYLFSRGISLDKKQLLELYMALGGVPFYLNQVSRGRSAMQNVAEICFGRDGALTEEFHNLFASLFNNSEHYENIVRSLGSRREGLLREELLEATGASSGGRLASRLRELEEAGFIVSLVPYGKRSKHVVYRLIDEYVHFYLKWIENAPQRMLRGDASKYWPKKRQTSGYQAWAGYSFEGICLKHVQQIADSLGLSAIEMDTGTWRYKPPKNRPEEHGAQVDLLFDRADGVTTLCEVKFCNDMFTVDKSCARELKRKIEIFEEKTRTKKSVFLALVTTYGLKPNTWSKDLIHNVVTADELFK